MTEAQSVPETKEPTLDSDTAVGPLTELCPWSQTKSPVPAAVCDQQLARAGEQESAVSCVSRPLPGVRKSTSHIPSAGTHAACGCSTVTGPSAQSGERSCYPLSVLAGATALSTGSRRWHGLGQDLTQTFCLLESLRASPVLRWECKQLQSFQRPFGKF